MPTLLLTSIVPALIFMAGCDRAAAQTQANSTPRAAEGGGGTASVLRARIAPPHDETVAAYRQSGAVNASAHPLTDREWALVERAIADLPPLHRDVLEQRLARLSFIDAPSSAGTALTRSSEGPDGGSLFDITIRADVLDKSLNVPLTVEVRDATGRVAVTVEPLRSPAVQARFAVADAVLARALAKTSQTP